MILKSSLSNKKGLSLIETIATIFIVSIVSAMIGSLTITTVKTYSLISAETNIQTEAVLISRKLLSQIGNFGPKDVILCDEGDYCLLFNERDTITFDDSNNAIVTQGTETLIVKIEDNDLLANGESIVNNMYTIKELDTTEGLTRKCISATGCTDAIITLKITLVDVDHNIEYQFTTSFPI